MAKERAQTCTWCVAHLWNNPLLLSPLTPPRQRFDPSRNKKTRRVNRLTCTQLATYACVSFNRGLKRRREGGQGLESGWRRESRWEDWRGGRLLGMRSVHQPRGFKYEARKGTKEETTPRPSLPYQWRID